MKEVILNNNINRVYQNTVGTVRISRTIRTITKQYHEYRQKNKWCSKPKQIGASTTRNERSDAYEGSDAYERSDDTYERSDNYEGSLL